MCTEQSGVEGPDLQDDCRHHSTVSDLTEVRGEDETQNTDHVGWDTEEAGYRGRETKIAER